jgi:non-ribosomal peptide synthetase component F
MTLMSGSPPCCSATTGQRDIAIGSSIANRGRKSLEGLIGFLTNTLVFRCDLAGNPSFLDLLARVAGTARDAYAWQDLPFEKLVEELHPDRALSHNPLFQVCFSLLQAHRDALRLGGLTLEQLDAVTRTSRFDLTLTMEDTREGLRGAFEYNTDLFEPATMERMVEHLHVLLAGIAAAPETPVLDLPLLTEAEHRALVFGRNQTTTGYPREACIPELFQAEVRRTPNAPAVKFRERVLSYAELNQQANRLAHHLTSLGVGPETAVAIAAERSDRMIVGLVAILKAGGYYVPFDPADPPERLGYLLSQVHARVVLAATRHHPRLPEGGWQVCDPEAVDFSSLPDTDPPFRNHPDNLAYTTYTSGSTGLPKGICIPTAA